LERLDALMPEAAGDAATADRDDEEHEKTMLSMHSSQASQQDQQAAMNDNQSAMGDAFNDSHNDDTFYLPPEISTTRTSSAAWTTSSPRRPRGPVHHLPRTDPLSPDGINRIDAIKKRRI